MSTLVGLKPASLLQTEMLADVRFGSKAVQRKRSCPLYPESGHVQRTSRCPLSANSGQPQRAVSLPTVVMHHCECRAGKVMDQRLVDCPDRHRAADYPSPVPRVALLALTRECDATLQRHAMMLATQRQSLRLLKSGHVHALRRCPLSANSGHSALCILLAV